MAVKSNYSLPVPIDLKFLDIEINLHPEQSKPIAIKLIIFYLASLLLWFFTLRWTFIGSGGLIYIMLFTVWWIAMTLFFGFYSSTREMYFKRLPALLEYLPTSRRKVYTLVDSDPYQLLTIVGISKIEKSGVIHFTNGDVGQLYSVVGSASRLLFESDKYSILNRIDAFWRKARSDYQIEFITAKEPQQVYTQIASAYRLNEGLDSKFDDPDLRRLLGVRYEVLKDHVGGSFKSIHQYALIRANNIDNLRSGHALLDDEIGTSTQMFRSIRLLNKDDALKVFSSIYRPVNYED